MPRGEERCEERGHSAWALSVVSLGKMTSMELREGSCRRERARRRQTGGARSGQVSCKRAQVAAAREYLARIR
ncbi:hypothetical protein CCMA1212_007090 [Trichoderma ghanense]|uniref:Uncharacterized protein n=1 Tax=Trichoderma ghanense TaxID=65468 RepID=A0ABY2GYJ7_9HYPO